MSKIAELSRDLVDRLLTIPQLDGSVVVGIVEDPNSTNNKNIPLPFASVRLSAESNTNSDPLIKRAQPIRSIFSVTLFMKNGSEDVVYDESYELLDLVRSAITGQTANNMSYPWLFVNSRIAHVDVDRIVHVQYYSVVTPK
jgi:hypothetical protein